MFEGIANFFKRIVKTEQSLEANSKDTAKERLHLVLMQDRANVSADFLELMKQEIIEVIKKYVDVDEKSIDVRLTNQSNEDGVNGAPALYANIPIINIKNENKAESMKNYTEEKDDEERDFRKNEINDNNNENIDAERKAEKIIEEEKAKQKNKEEITVSEVKVIEENPEVVVRFSDDDTNEDSEDSENK